MLSRNFPPSCLPVPCIRGSSLAAAKSKKFENTSLTYYPWKSHKFWHISADYSPFWAYNLRKSYFSKHISADYNYLRYLLSIIVSPSIFESFCRRVSPCFLRIERSILHWLSNCWFDCCGFSSFSTRITSFIAA